MLTEEHQTLGAYLNNWLSTKDNDMIMQFKHYN